MAHQPGVFPQESCGPIISRDGLRSRADDRSICGKLLRNEIAWHTGLLRGMTGRPGGLLFPRDGSLLPATCGLSVFWGKWGNLRGEGVRSEDHHSATKWHLLETCVGSTTSVTERLTLMYDSWKRAAEDC